MVATESIGEHLEELSSRRREKEFHGTARIHRGDRTRGDYMGPEHRGEIRDLPRSSDTTRRRHDHHVAGGRAQRQEQLTRRRSDER